MSEQAWITVNVEPFELVGLIDWHIEQKRVAVNNEEFTTAEYHRKRALELTKVMPSKSELPEHRNENS